MIEIQSHHLAIGFQLVGTMSSFEQAGGSKARKLCFQGAGSFFVTGSQGSAVSSYFMYPASGTDQDNDFFQGKGL